MDKPTRARAQETFSKQEGVVIAATIAFGMGIDKPDVRFVVHMDLPKSIESYYQETGRAGRDGAKADVLMLYGAEDIATLRRFIHEGNAEEAQKKLEMRKLEALIGYAKSRHCRRKILLNYFGESAPDNCGNCDNCRFPPATTDATVEMEKLLSCIHRAACKGFGFGENHIIDILRGKATDKVKRFGHDGLTIFGIGTDTSKAMWKSLLCEAVSLHYVESNDRGALELTPEAHAFFKHRSPVMAKAEGVDRSKKRKKAKSTAKKDTPDDATATLYEALKSLRRELATGEDIPAYVIFSNATLEEMATIRPLTLEAMAGIHGVGEYKLKTYAPAFLAVIVRMSQAQK
jgi:ATP-dependent DNA helicase RecQ